MASIEFKLPDIGEGVHEGEIVRWIVPVGGTVSEDDPVVEVMTDKATVEIPSPASGSITQHLFEEGDVANVGDVIFMIDTAGGGAAPAAAPAAAAAPAPAPEVTPVAAPPTPAVPAAPAPAAAPAASGGELEFKLPDIGEGVHEGEIVRWIVPEGGEVAEDDPVVEVMTDKATVEIPSPAAGSISRHMVTEGEIANVGDVIFVIALAASGGGAASAAPAAPAAAPAAPTAHGAAASAVGNAPAAAAVAVAPANPNKKVLAAPATRRLARELAIDLTTVIGSGPDGRVKPEDVRAVAAAPAAPAAVTPADSGAAVTPIPAFPAVMGSREYDTVPFRGIRRKTAEAMSRSKFTAAHFSLIEEVDCTEMVEARGHAKAAAAKYGVKITYMPYIMKATAIALQEFPQLNAELDEEAKEIKVKKYSFTDPRV